MKRILYLLLLLSLLITACQAGSTSLVGKWSLTTYGQENALTPAVTDSSAGLTFNDDGTVNGSSGCNGVGGEYTVDGDVIKFGPFVSTLMACEDPIMSQESAMMQVLNGTATYAIDGDILTISKDGSALVFSAIKADEQP